MEGSFADHVVQATLPVLKICLLGAVGACLARMVSASGRVSQRWSPLPLLYMQSPAVAYDSNQVLQNNS
jgi:hypothetical protein